MIMDVAYPVARALRKFGRDLRDARLRRRIPAVILAERASISRTTLHKIENGDPGVALGNYAMVLLPLGLLDRLGEVAALANDPLGMDLEQQILPKRIRL